MAHNPHAPQEPDPAGSTQMFQAFVNDDAAGRRAPAPAGAANSSSGVNVGVIVAVAVIVAAVVAVAVLALS